MSVRVCARIGECVYVCACACTCVCECACVCANAVTTGHADASRAAATSACVL